VTKISAVIPDVLAAELERRADAQDRSMSAVVRRAIALYLEDVRPANGWRVEEDWSGVWAVRDKPGCPGVVERIRLEDGPGAVVERPLASIDVVR
jgi:hypothetical protein